VACLTTGDPTPVAAALQSVLPEARVHVLAADNGGVLLEA
jgi:hypothetical protein